MPGFALVNQGAPVVSVHAEIVEADFAHPSLYKKTNTRPERDRKSVE
jgi:hypothetical protein